MNSQKAEAIHSMDRVNCEGPDAVLSSWQKYCRGRTIQSPGSFVPFTNAETDQSIPSRFEKMARLHSERLALKVSSERWSYGALNAAANRLAHTLLRECAQGLESVVLVLDQEATLFIALLAVLKAGKTYVYIDPSFPSERNHYICADAGAKYILTNNAALPVATALAAPDQRLLNLDALTLETCADNLALDIDPDAPACIIYTSGSTGKPKGVVQTHRNTLHGCMRRTNLQKLSPEDRLTLFYSCSVMGAVYNLYGALMNGAALFPYTIRKEGLDGLAKWLQQEEITVYHSIASVFRHFAAQTMEKHGFPAIRLVIFGGERVLVSDVRAVRELFSRCQVLTGLGSTETGTVRHVVVDRDVPLLGKVVPLGYAVEDVEVVLLNEAGEPVGDNVIGEITICSRYIAREYWQNPLASAKSFARDTSDAAVVIYHTGDLGRRLADGMLVHHGRKDFQVKIRGFRIEIQEVETALLEHPAIAEAVVVAHTDASEEHRLVAHLVARQGEVVSAETLRRFLQQKLPAYMIPSIFIMLPAMPLTPNGKIDRQALPLPDTVQYTSTGDSAAPQTDTEKKLAAIWAQLLHVPHIGRNDDFFALGGHSLLSTQVATRSRSIFGVEIPMRVLFEKTTLAELAAYMDTHCGPQNTVAAADWRTITPMPQNATIPLSSAQLRMWLLENLQRDSAAYNITNALRLTGPLDVGAVEKSVNTLLQRHEILRTVFVMSGDQPVQHINPHHDIAIPLIDLQGQKSSDRYTIARDIIERQARHRFDLEHGPLLQVALLRLSPNDHILVMHVCHIIFDNIWSAGVFFQEFAACYEAYSTGTAPRLPALPIQYRDYAYWQQHTVPAEVWSSQLHYWRQKLADAPPLLQLPTDHPRPMRSTFKGGRVSFQFPKTLLDALNSLSQECGTTLFMTLMAAWKTLLFRYSHQQDVVVGTPIGNRQQVETEPLMGLFINTLALRTDLGGNPTFKTLLQRVRETALEAYANQDVPYEHLVSQLWPNRSAGVAPFFQVLFIFQNAAVSACSLPGIQTTRLDVHGGSAKFDLTLSVRESEAGLSGSLEYSSDLFQRDTIERMLGHFHTLLTTVVANPDEAITRLPLLTNAERQQLLVDWNQTAADYPADQCLQGLIEAQVAVAPERIAVEFNGKSLTYSQLNARANQLARRLQTLGVGPDVLVGVYVERSFDLLVSVLAVLKAGGAYVPLDPDYPPDRIALILEDAAASVVISSSALSAHLPTHRGTTVVLEHALEASQDTVTPQVTSAVAPHHLAYVIYTSGSTGRPKGVQICHRSVVNFLWSMAQAPGITADDVVLATTSLCFDISVLELFLPLLAGARCRIVSRDVAADGQQLASVLQDGVTVMQATPSHWQLLLQAGWQGAPQLKVLCGGEMVTRDLAEALLARSAQVWNMYGPTETTVWSSTVSIRPQQEVVTIGRPIHNTQFYILDTQMQPVPVGVPGELFIGGDGVARAYQGRPDLTTEHFVSSPFSKKKGVRLYRTGDLARYRASGAVECLGRVDNQIKLRGYRIELGEIEARLAEHAAVRTAAVMLREDHANDKRLVAYLAPVDGTHPDTAAIRAFCKAMLPEYMVPSMFVVMDQLPMTPNGKVDRKALPVPAREQIDNGGSYVAPRNDTEKILVNIWQEVLHVERIGVADNFFELGGHSLSMTSVVARVNEHFAVKLTLAEFFEEPTIAALAKHIGTQAASPAEEDLLAMLANLSEDDLCNWVSSSGLLHVQAKHA